MKIEMTLRTDRLRFNEARDRLKQEILANVWTIFFRAAGTILLIWILLIWILWRAA